MGLNIEYEEGQTPLSEVEMEGLLIKSITTHGELNEHEQLNIEGAIKWLLRKRVQKDKILSEVFIKTLHKKMFENVWRWAGKFRKSEKNIGVKWIYIETELQQLLSDVNYWIKHKTYTADEIAIRFKHRLVSIHCFPNGNGRHARIMADLMIEIIFSEKLFSWNQSSIIKADAARKEYIQSIKEADNGDILPLIKFARS